MFRPLTSPAAARLVRAASAVLLVSGAAALLSALPVGVGLARLQSRLAEAGASGMLAFGIASVAAASAGNYLFGLTAVRFWPYVLASWAFMLPGTLLYVWLGHAGGRAARGARPAAEWALLGAGLAATAAATWYLTRLARRRLAREKVTPDSPTSDQKRRGFATTAPSALLPLSAVIVFGVGLLAHARKDSLASLFGPPVVAPREAYAGSPGVAVFDHGPFGTLLKRHVSEGGAVDYEGLRTEADALDGYIARLGDAPFAALGRDEKLALLINAYNAFTLRLVLDHWPVASIRDIPAGERWKAKRWTLGGRTLSLDDIEHEEVRPKFREPRVHFALVCAARGCPPLRREAYAGDRIEAQLEDQARYVHSQPRWFRWDAPSNTVHLTEVYRWYGEDFEREAGSVLRFVSRYAPPVQAALAAGLPPRIEWIEYDWSLNAQAAR